jgi:hypothetical protein
LDLAPTPKYFPIAARRVWVDDRKHVEGWITVEPPCCGEWPWNPGSAARD